MSKRYKKSPQIGKHNLPLPNGDTIRIRHLQIKGTDMIEFKKWVPDRLRGQRPDQSVPLLLPLIMAGVFIELVQQVAGRGQQH